MLIASYAFGSITIDGKTYTSDVIISPEGVNDAWWRREGHKLQIEDLEPVLQSGPDTLVIGTGNVGCMQVPRETLAHLESLGIEIHMARTGEAVKIYNDLEPGAGAIVAALHLTC